MTIGKSLTNFGKIIPSRHAMVLIFGLILTFNFLFGVLSIPTARANGTLTLYAPETSSPPTIDGILSPGEWSDAAHYSFFFVPSSSHPPDYIDIFLMSDTNTLYIAYDVQPDNTTDDDDRGVFALDLDNNDTKDFLFTAYRDPTYGRDVQLNGVNCTSLIWGIAFGNSTSPEEPSRNHTTIEIWVRFNSTPYTTQTATGLTHLPFGTSPMGIVFGGYGTLIPDWVYGNSSQYINWLDSDASKYANLYLGSPPDSGVPWWVLLLVVGLPAIAVVVVFLFYRNKEYK